MRSNINLLTFGLKHWKLLFGVAIVSGLLAVVFTGKKFMPPEFESSAVIYPANLGKYGTETPLEQMLQYLESNDIRDSIIRKFDLAREYEIDTTNKGYRYFLNLEYQSHISIDETEHESIRIAALDQDPQTAKQIVDEIIHQVNLKIRMTEREKYHEIVVIQEDLLNNKREQIDSLEKSVQKVSTEYGILDYPTQSERVTEGYMEFLISGKKGKDFEEAKTLYENLQKYGRIYHDLHAQLTHAVNEYSSIQVAYEKALKDYNKMQTYTNVIVKAEVPDKKAKPVRWFILAMAVGSSVLFVLVLLMIAEFRKA